MIGSSFRESIPLLFSFKRNWLRETIDESSERKDKINSEKSFQVNMAFARLISSSTNSFMGYELKFTNDAVKINEDDHYITRRFIHENPIFGNTVI